VWPADITCPRCSKPLRDNSVALLRQGELLHVRCRSQEVTLEAMEARDRAQRAWGTSARLAAKIAHQRLARSGSVSPTDCPLCGAAATFAFARDEWVGVTDCSCGGFHVWVWLVPHLPRLSASARSTLSRRISALRRHGSEAWLATRDGMLAGALVISGAPPFVVRPPPTAPRA
jgi:hypothetical protein